jgi:hypothetical protein
MLPTIVEVRPPDLDGNQAQAHSQGADACREPENQQQQDGLQQVALQQTAKSVKHGDLLDAEDGPKLQRQRERFLDRGQTAGHTEKKT